MPYSCAFGCKSYNPSCDACDDSTSDQTTGWAEPKRDTDDRFEAANKGMTLREYRDMEDDD